jgi:hypothetical protein
MTLISKTNTYTTGSTLTATKYSDTDRDDIIDVVNGDLDNTNIAASAAIAYSKLNLTGAVLNADLAGSIAAAKITNTAVTLSDTQTLTNKTLTSPTINTATINTSNIVGGYSAWVSDSDGATITFDLSAGNKHKVTLGGNRTLALSNVQNGHVFIVRLTQDGSGSRTVGWFSTVNWAGGSAPTLTTTAGKSDTFGFIQTAADTYDGYVIGMNI